MPTFVENETELRTATGTAVTTTSGGGQLVGVELTRTAGETQQGQDYLREQLALLLILLSFYCLPIFLVTILSLIDIFHQESHRIEGRFVEAVRTVATDPAAYTNIIKSDDHAHGCGNYRR